MHKSVANQKHMMLRQLLYTKICALGHVIITNADKNYSKLVLQAIFGNVQERRHVLRKEGMEDFIITGAAQPKDGPNRGGSGSSINYVNALGGGSRIL